MKTPSIRCFRCSGLRVATHFVTGASEPFDGWLCLNCGDMVDPVILANRNSRADGPAMSMGAKGMRGAGGAVSPARYQRLT